VIVILVLMRRQRWEEKNEIHPIGDENMNCHLIDISNTRSIRMESVSICYSRYTIELKANRDEEWCLAIASSSSWSVAFLYIQQNYARTCDDDKKVSSNWVWSMTWEYSFLENFSLRVAAQMMNKWLIYVEFYCWLHFLDTQSEANTNKSLSGQETKAVHKQKMVPMLMLPVMRVIGE